MNDFGGEDGGGHETVAYLKNCLGQSVGEWVVGGCVPEAESVSGEGRGYDAYLFGCKRKRSYLLGSTIDQAPDPTERKSGPRKMMAVLGGRARAHVSAGAA